MRIFKCIFLITILFFQCKSSPKGASEAIQSHEEVSCKQSTVFEYNGLTSTEALTVLLESSSKPFIKGLTDSTKQSIIRHLRFENGMVETLDGTDDHIKNLFSTHAKEFLKEILGSEVILCTLDTKPKVTLITQEQYEEMKRQSPAIYFLSSWCTDCTKTDTSPCCVLPGDGCRDNLIQINQEYYSVKQ
ncbi:MAG: hypothetical protein SH818_08935 [Saprospiraceae bacterium]|nr:hypothetical protein [Saprospiraceae bacterium]